MTLLAWMRPTWGLAWREVLRFLRQKSRVIGSLAQPLIIWAFFGFGFSASFRPGGDELTYGTYVFPGVLLLMMLFSSVFSAMTLIEDRAHGFLQGVLASPVPRSAIVAGKIGGSTLIATLQAVLLLACAPLAALPFPPLGLIMALAISWLIATGFSAMGFAIAWQMRSTAGFHGVMMAVLMPAWMLSGALFPVAGVPQWMAWIMALNPLTHAHIVLTTALNGTLTAAEPQVLRSLAITVGWIAVSLAISTWRVEQMERGAVGTA